VDAIDPVIVDVHVHGNAPVDVNRNGSTVAQDADR
jgi:N-acetylglucosamine-6-phosphate deacetylase